MNAAYSSGSTAPHWKPFAMIAPLPGEAMRAVARPRKASRAALSTGPAAGPPLTKLITPPPPARNEPNSSRARNTGPFESSNARSMSALAASVSGDPAGNGGSRISASSSVSNALRTESSTVRAETGDRLFHVKASGLRTALSAATADQGDAFVPAAACGTRSDAAATE